MLLQLRDIYGVLVPGTQFWITITINENSNEVTLQLPTINFQTGPFANSPIEPPNNNPANVPGVFPPFNAGGLYTVDGYLPPKIRPTDIENRSWIVSSNDGMSLPFSFTQPPSTLPTPIVGYIVQITNAGGLVVQGAGTFGNNILAGPQILMPTTISYLLTSPTKSLSRNVQVSTGPTDVTQFPYPQSGDSFRDTHVVDAWAGKVVYSWTDNSMIADKTNGTLNLMVAVGKLVDGKLKVGLPIQLTNFPPGVLAWDTAVAINRNNPKNIVVSYGTIIYTNPNGFSPICAAISFDGGKTWPAPYDDTTPVPYNGPTNVQPTGFSAPGVLGEFGDNRGVSSDKYGNIWYSSTNLFNDTFTLINQPFFMVSSDQGVTWKLIYTVPPPDSANEYIYDFPQYCFGTNYQGVYGLYFRADYPTPLTGDADFVVGFIPILGLGNFDTANITFAELSYFLNNHFLGSITASNDGRVWHFGYTGGIGPTFMAGPMSSIISMRTIFKSPGPIDQNYAGPWDFNIANYADNILDSGTEISDPNGYFNSAQTNIYDNVRQALYQTSMAHLPDDSQNMYIFFAISRNNGQTWSKAINISNNNTGNRGFQSMALDDAGNLFIGWYDGRGDPTYKTVQYYGAVITAKELDTMVNAIPLSNPLYTVPSATIPRPAPKVKLTDVQREQIKKHLLKKFGH